MTARPENPTAFPHTCNQHFAEQQNIPLGMTLRDYFAGQALAGLLAHGIVHELGKNFTVVAANAAYEAADAMLKARQS